MSGLTGSCWAACVAVLLSACAARDQAGAGGPPPTAEQNRFVDDLIAKAGVDSRTLAPRDGNWSLVFEAGILEVGRQCDLYVDAFLGANPEQRSAVQGPNASIALGLSPSLFNAGVYPVLLASDPSAMRNVVQKGRQAYFDKLARDRTEINSRPGVMLALQGYLTQCSASAVAANLNNFATGAPSVLSPDKQTAQDAVGVLAPGMALLRRATEIVSGAVQDKVAPVPGGNLPSGRRAEENFVVSAELKAAQRALGVSDDGIYGPITRGAIGDFEKGMNRRSPREWPDSVGSGALVGRTGRTLPILSPMPAAEFSSPFERAYLGNDGGFFTAEPLVKVDVGRLDGVLQLLGVASADVPAGNTPQASAAKLKLMRERIAVLRIDKKLPSPQGAVLDAQLFDAVFKDSPLNPDAKP